MLEYFGGFEKLVGFPHHTNQSTQINQHSETAAFQIPLQPKLLGLGLGLAVRCVSVDPVLSAVWSRWMESSTRLGTGFRTLKKTTEAPYTTKVNYIAVVPAVEPPDGSPLSSVSPRAAHIREFPLGVLLARCAALR